jgi:hypothetical protein
MRDAGRHAADVQTLGGVRGRYRASPHFTPRSTAIPGRFSTSRFPYSEVSRSELRCAVHRAASVYTPRRQLGVVMNCAHRSEDRSVKPGACAVVLNWLVSAISR